ncbi:hypothetical protein SADUNF_Sadunf04G0008200 [Salix dunnii]|uniref:Uncharacterized protein n=1 Tax=Salix dunnii TaxID=1413687 RepID=A0A835KCF0_9ROSI|nr:hypothetical protein SADUNF_Sadunf04G0008200 [Salix dunnii]
MPIKFLCTCSPASPRDSQLSISASSKEHKLLTPVHQLAARIIEKAAINLTYLDRICHFQLLFQCLNLYLSGKYASLVTSMLKKQDDTDKFTVPCHRHPSVFQLLLPV